MDEELVFRQFEEIEQKIERLIKICKAHEATNLELKSKLKSLEEEIQGKVEAEYFTILVNNCLLVNFVFLLVDFFTADFDTSLNS